MEVTSSTSQALAKRSSDTALMPPPPRPKRIKRPQKVLDEDAYTSAISQIIARDFFPGLVETESQQEYLDALDSQDEAWIASAGKRLRQVMTPGPNGRRVRGRRGTSLTPMVGRGGQTPRGWGGETPMSVAGSEISSTTTATDREGDEIDTNMSLTAFQTKYTSEDNESFYKLLDKQNLKRAEKYAWMWAGNKIPSARQIAQSQRSQRLLTSKPTPSPDAVEEQDPNQQQQQQQQQQLTISTVAPDPDDRKAMPETWRSKPDNEFMFAPDSIEDHTQTVHQRAEESSRAPPKAVLYHNTRLPLPPNPDHIPPSPSLTAINDALSGQPRPTASEPGLSGTETPRVNGYAYVDDDEPSTTLDDHHFLFGTAAGDASVNPFRIRAQSRREDLHHRLVERVARTKRVVKREAEVRTPVPRFASSPRVEGGLTPAGRRLWGRVGTDGGGVQDAKGLGVGVGSSGLRMSWTPKSTLKATPKGMVKGVSG